MERGDLISGSPSGKSTVSRGSSIASSVFVDEEADQIKNDVDMLMKKVRQMSDSKQTYAPPERKMQSKSFIDSNITQSSSESVSQDKTPPLESSRFDNMETNDINEGAVFASESEYERLVKENERLQAEIDAVNRNSALLHEENIRLLTALEKSKRLRSTYESRISSSSL